MVIIGEEMRNMFYFEENIFTSWWLDELREEQREGKTVGFPYDRL